MRSGKLVIAQGGGPTAVINQSLVGAVLEARLFPQIERIYGARYGVRGIVDEDFVDLSVESRANLEAVAATSSSALGSTRDKPDLAYCRNIFASLKAHGASWFLYIGGNDSADTVRIVSEEAARESYDLRSIHIPKTIDNDLMENDHAPGFPSAARFVAQAVMGADLDNRSLPGVYVAVVMGRHSGFLTAASAAARTVEGDGPHLIYLPERTFDKAKFLSEIQTVHDRLGRCVVALSEGIHDTDGTPLSIKLAKTAETDAHGNVQLSGTGALGDLLCGEIKSKLGLKRVRGDTFGYLQRSFAGCASDVDRREAREVGEFAVKQAIWGAVDGSVTIRRIGNYAIDYALVELAKVGGKTKVMPDEFIAPWGSDVTPAFLEYLRPLLGRDVPQSAHLRGGDIAKVLKR
ncbi:6-phosphofructokinase [Rhodopila sp.]|uniref:6-phosphofructokinase n=1 Tax=Rhodopila sp. TaxID=2480087 RepID=UPI003D0A10AC